jgi:hypothetical protein
LATVETFGIADQHLEVGDAVDDVGGIETEAAVLKLPSRS